MTQDLLDKARAAVAAARKQGAQGVRASARRAREGETEWRDGKLDRMRESTEVGLGITLFVDGRFSANNTSDLRPEAIVRFVDEITAATRLLAADPHRQLADPRRYENRFGGELGVFDEQAAGANAADRRRVARELEQAVRAAPGADQLISVTTAAGDLVTESALVCSNGMEATFRSTRFWTFAEASVRDEGDRKPEGWWYARTTQKSKQPSIASVGQEALRRALRDRGGKAEKSGKYACVIENSVTSRLLSDLLAPLGGQAIQQKRSFLADKIGKKIAADVLTVSDDPLLVEGLASIPFDGEGMSHERRPIIERGVLESFYLDTYYASKLGAAPTTGASSNLVFAAGTRDLAGLCAAMGTGILVTGFSGGNSNSATGDFSVGIRGQWVEGGKPVRAVSEMNLAGNALELWGKLLELGSDPYLYGSNRCPSLRFDELQFSGV